MARPTGSYTGINDIQVADVVIVNWPGWNGTGIVMERRWQKAFSQYIYIIKMVECENPRLLYTKGGFYAKSLTKVTEP